MEYWECLFKNGYHCWSQTPPEHGECKLDGHQILEAVGDVCIDLLARRRSLIFIHTEGFERMTCHMRAGKHQRKKPKLGWLQHLKNVVEDFMNGGPLQLSGFDIVQGKRVDIIEVMGNTG